jgi:phosphatidylserine synthase
MSETMPKPEHESPVGLNQSTGAVSSVRWTRTHTVWILIFLTFTPGLVVASFRGWWEQLPAWTRGAAYTFSGILIVAACILIMTGNDKQDADRKS